MEDTDWRFPKFHAHLSCYSKKELIVPVAQNTPFSSPFCLPLAQGSKILTR